MDFCGQAIALRLAAESAVIAALDIAGAGLKETVKKMIALGGHAKAYVLDISNATVVDAIAKAILANFGKVTTRSTTLAFSTTISSCWRSMRHCGTYHRGSVSKAFICCARATSGLTSHGSATIVNHSPIAGVVVHGWWWADLPRPSTVWSAWPNRSSAVLFLALDEVSFVYGSQLVTDGGWTAV